MNQETRDFAVGWGFVAAVIGVSLLLWAAIFYAIWALLWRLYP